MTDTTPEGPPDEATDDVTGDAADAAVVGPAGAAGVGAIGGAKGQPARRVHWGTRTRVAVASLALIAMMFLFVFPTRSYIAQQRQVGHARHAVAVLKAQNEVLARQARRLQTPAEIERLARQQFNMVLPGEQAYNVVPAPAESSATTTTIP